MAFEKFKVADFDTSGARIHFRHGGKGPPLLLLHGNPLTHYSWHKVADRLAESFYVVAADLRGYGDSSAPEADKNYLNYSFRAMAQDQVEVMASLGFSEFNVAGIDRGGRVTHRMCLDHPDKVKKVALLDIVPTRLFWDSMDKDLAVRAWHWSFMAQPPDLPERMMGAVPAEWFFRGKVDTSIGDRDIGFGMFTEDAVAEYIRCFNEKTIRGSCNDYRAAATCDYDMDKADADKKILAPLLVLWGARSHTGRRFGDLIEVWRQSAVDVRGSGLQCGHYVNEEMPDPTFDAFMKHFSDR